MNKENEFTLPKCFDLPTAEQIYNRYKHLSRNTGGGEKWQVSDADHSRPAKCHRR